MATELRMDPPVEREEPAKTELYVRFKRKKKGGGFHPTPYPLILRVG